ncbi:uncharacterized protein [Anabrus simplex]|uniref:uncharacterized protein n=1 Tax=Anabrus simplex TaxID=316456 RepID=UPI0035A28BBA
MQEYFITLIITLTVTVSGTFYGSSAVDPTSLTEVSSSQSSAYLLETQKFPYMPCSGSEAYQTCDLTCKTSGYCYEERAGDGLSWHPIVNCSNYCTPTGCSDLPVHYPYGCGLPKANKISCIVEGIYPDPLDCRKALYCSPGAEPTTCKVCDSNFGYNPCTGKCDVQLSKNMCPDNYLQVCNSLGETKAIVRNTGIFYTCAVGSDGLIFPVMNRCPSGYFNETLGLCVKSNESSCSLLHNFRASC